MTDLQFLPKAYITSNTDFFYKNYTQNENLIKLNQEKIELRHNIPSHLIKQNIIKEIETDNYSAFDKAVIETFRTEDYIKTKHKTVEGKREVIEKIVKERNQMIRESFKKEKADLKIVLERVIKDALKFTKDNNPMMSMLPNKLSNAIIQIKEDKMVNGSLLNMSSGSLNLSFKSNTSTGSVKKYEANQFLKLLGLDLKNLRPDNIKIDIDTAYNFIKRWKVKQEDIKKIIRFKVVNEIMNVEERRSVQKIDKMNKRINKYFEHKKNYGRKNKDNEDLIEQESKFEFIEKKTRTFSTNNNVARDFFNKSNLVVKNFNLVNSKYMFNKITVNMKTATIGGKSRKSTGITLSNTKLNSTSKLKSKNEKIKNYSLVNFNKKRIDTDSSPNKKKKIVYNSYKNVDKIFNIINENENLKDNESLFNHFSNIKYKKNIDDLAKKLINRNKLKIAGLSPSSSMNNLNSI